MEGLGSTGSAEESKCTMNVRMMHIAFIIESDYNSGGMERMLSTMANRLTAWFDITILTAFNEGRAPFFSIAETVGQVDLGLAQSDYPSGRRRKKAYRKRLEAYLVAHRQDVCVSLGSLEYGFLPHIKDGSRKVLWFHFALNYDLLTTHLSSIGLVNRCIGRLRQARRLLCARGYDRVVVLSEADARQWRRFVSRVSVIYNPVTIKAQRVADYSVRRAMAVGRLDRQKGFDTLIAAWKRVVARYPDWQLDIYGDGPQKETLQRLIAAEGLQQSVFLRGRADDVASAYARHSLFVLSSRCEGFGLVLVEAGICGLPLVSFDCQQGPAEIITPENGILVRPVGDVAALATAISKLAGDAELRRAMGQQALNLASRFNLEDIAGQWKEMLSTLGGLARN